MILNQNEGFVFFFYKKMITSLYLRYTFFPCLYLDYPTVHRYWDSWISSRQISSKLSFSHCIFHDPTRCGKALLVGLDLSPPAGCRSYRKLIHYQGPQFEYDSWWSGWKNPLIQESAWGEWLNHHGSLPTEAWWNHGHFLSRVATISSNPCVF